MFVDPTSSVQFSSVEKVQLCTVYFLCVTPWSVGLQDDDIMYSFYDVPLPQVFTPSLHQPPEQDQHSRRLDPYLPETFHYTSASIQGFWNQQDFDERRLLFVILKFGVFRFF